MIALDVDFLGESLLLSGGGAPLVLLSQMESQAGEMSTFPIYDPVLGALVSPNDQTNQSNEGDASVFDISFLNEINVDFSGGGFTSGVAIVIALPSSDTDADGVTDDIDNCTFVHNPDQRDTDSDGHGNRCDGDLNNDCVVNPVDLGIFRSLFFSSDEDGDLNGDGVVNPVDLGIFRSLFFAPPGPSAPGALCN